jgi:hypothetical protein
MEMEEAEDLAAPGVQFAGAGRGGAGVELLPLEPAAHGAPAHVEFAGDLPGRKPALM